MLKDSFHVALLYLRSKDSSDSIKGTCMHSPLAGFTPAFPRCDITFIPLIEND